MVERLTPPRVSQKRVLVLAKAKSSDREKQNTRPLHPACSAVLVWLDIAKFVRDGMTKRINTVSPVSILQHAFVISGHDFAHRRSRANGGDHGALLGRELFGGCEDAFGVSSRKESDAAAVGQHPVPGRDRDVPDL